MVNYGSAEAVAYRVLTGNHGRNTHSKTWAQMETECHSFLWPLILKMSYGLVFMDRVSFGITEMNGVNSHRKTALRLRTSFL